MAETPNPTENLVRFLQYKIEKERNIFGKERKLMPDVSTSLGKKLRGKKWKDWNDILQKSLESALSGTESKSNGFERKKLIRSQIGQISMDFADEALPICKKIIAELYSEDKEYEAVDTEGFWYLEDGIFFEVIVDIENFYGSDEVAAKVAGHEFKTHQVLLDLSINGQIPKFYFPFMLLVDYLGTRILVSSCPSVDSSTLIHGSLDGQKFMTSKELESLANSVSKALNIRPRKFDDDDSSIQLGGNIECHKAADGRYYLINLAHLMPPNGFGNKEVLHRMFRPEFLIGYKKPLTSYGYDIWGKLESGKYEDKEKDEAQGFLETVWIPAVASVLDKQFKLGKTPQNEDFQTVVQFMHRSGVNLRYLGLIRQLVNSSILQQVLLVELLARFFKSLLRNRLRELKADSQAKYQQTIVKFANSIFSGEKSSEEYWDNMKEALTKKFIRPLNKDESEQPLSVLKLTLTSLLFLRFSKLCGITWSRESLKKLNSQYAKLSDSDIESIQVMTKLPHVITFFQGGNSQKLAKEKHCLQWRERLLEKTCDFYNTSLERSPRDTLILVTLAQSMHERGLMKKIFKKTAEAQFFFDKAYELFEEAFQHDTNEKKSVANEWGISIYREATIQSPAISTILKAALEKFNISGNEEFIRLIQEEMPMAVEAPNDALLVTNRKQVLKIGVIGSFGIGKTSMIVRYTDDIFSEGGPGITLGVDFKPAIIEIEGRNYKIKIGDTAGQEQFRLLTSGFYRDLDGIILCFDLTDQNSFSQVKNDWYKEITTFGGNMLVGVAGLKSDLENHRVVSSKEAQEFAESIFVPYFETSAKTGANIDEMFLEVVKSMTAKKLQKINKTGLSINSTDTSGRTSKGSMPSNGSYPETPLISQPKDTKNEKPTKNTSKELEKGNNKPKDKPKDKPKGSSKSKPKEVKNDGNSGNGKKGNEKEKGCSCNLI